MAKAQWTAASQTVGQQPTGLDLAYSGGGQSLADWTIVSHPGASGGKALRLVPTNTLYRWLWVQGISSTGRVNLRGRFFVKNAANSLIPGIVAGKATGAGAIHYGVIYVNSGRFPFVRKYTPVAADMFYPKPATNPAWAAADVWVGFNYTYDPAAATNKISIALWREALETEETTIFVHSSSSGIDALVDGSRIGFGSHPGDSGSLIDWLTIGTDGDDADTAPIGPAERQRSRLILTPW